MKYETRLDYLLACEPKITDDAANLFDGGWGSEDHDELMDEYGVSSEYADDLCTLFKYYETGER